MEIGLIVMLLVLLVMAIIGLISQGGEIDDLKQKNKVLNKRLKRNDGELERLFTFDEQFDTSDQSCLDLKDLKEFRERSDKRTVNIVALIEDIAKFSYKVADSVLDQKERIKKLEAMNEKNKE